MQQNLILAEAPNDNRRGGDNHVRDDAKSTFSLRENELMRKLDEHKRYSPRSIRFNTLELPSNLIVERLTDIVPMEFSGVDLSWVSTDLSGGDKLELPDPIVVAAVLGASATIVVSIINAAVNIHLEYLKAKTSNLEVTVRGMVSGNEKSFLIDEGPIQLSDVFELVEESEIEITFQRKL